MSASLLVCLEAKVRSSGSHALPYRLASCVSAPCAVTQGFAGFTYVYLCMRMYADEPFPIASIIQPQPPCLSVPLEN